MDTDPSNASLKLTLRYLSSHHINLFRQRRLMLPPRLPAPPFSADGGADVIDITHRAQVEIAPACIRLLLRLLILFLAVEREIVSRQQRTAELVIYSRWSAEHYSRQ